jgi:hypothetical protein
MRHLELDIERRLSKLGCRNVVLGAAIAHLQGDVTLPCRHLRADARLAGLRVAEDRWCNRAIAGVDGPGTRIRLGRRSNCHSDDRVAAFGRNLRP